METKDVNKKIKYIFVMSTKVLNQLGRTGEGVFGVKYCYLRLETTKKNN